MDTSLVAGLENLVKPATLGAPESCLRWTCKSVRKLAEQLVGAGQADSIRGMSRQGRNVLFWTGTNADQQQPFPSVGIV